MTDKVAEAIAVIAHPEGGFVVRIGGDAMEQTLSLFEAHGSYSNGPAWGALIEHVVATDPRMSDYELDSEGRGWSSTRAPLERLRSILLEAVADAATLRELITAARLAGRLDL